MTLCGPGLLNTPQIAALRGPVSATNRRREKRKQNTRRSPKNVNTARRRAPRTSLRNVTCQRVKGQSLQREIPEDLVLEPAPLHTSIIRHRGGDGGLHCPSGTHGPTLDPTHPVSLDLEGGPGLTQDPEALLGLEVGLCLDPDLGPTLDQGLDPGQDQDLGTDLGLQIEREVYPDPRDRKERASLKWKPRFMCQRSCQTAK